MATKFYLRKSSQSGASLNSDAILGVADVQQGLLLTPGTTLSTESLSTLAGPIGGLSFLFSDTNVIFWVTNPLDAVTVSGTITVNLWMAESNMAANAGPEIGIWAGDFATAGWGASGSAKVDNERGVEFPVTTRAAQNWTVSGYTSFSINAGERIAVVVGINDAGGTMGGGNTCSLGYDDDVAAADGDSWVQFTETITEQSAAAANPPYRSPMTQLLAHAREYRERPDGLLEPVKRLWRPRQPVFVT